MLQFMRKHAKNWAMKVILGLIIIVFIFYFGSMGGGDRVGDVATVIDKKISHADFRKEYENLLDLYRRQYGENLTEQALKKLNLKQQALDNLINRAVILYKAQELKIEASNEEIQAAVASYPAFQRDGIFDNRLYQMMLRNLRMKTEDFEETQKNAIIIAKLEALIRESVKVSDREALDIYRLQNEKTDVAFMKISCQDLRGKVRASDEDLDKFLINQGESFRVPERMQVKYLFLRGEDFSRSATVSDAEVKDYYNLHGDRFKKRGGEKASLAEVREKITAALRNNKGLDLAQAEAKKARTVIYQEENFDEYARKNGLVVHSSESFSRNNPPKDLAIIKDLDEHLGNLKADQISPILSTPKGFFIVKLISRKASYIPKLSEIRNELEGRYAQVESQRLCKESADEALGRLKKGDDFLRVAREKGWATGETGFFSPGATIPKIGQSKEIAQSVHQLSAKKPYSDSPFLVGGQYVIIRFKDRKLDARDFEAKKQGMTQFLLRLKEQTYLQSWIMETREALTKEGKIRVSEEVDKL